MDFPAVFVPMTFELQFGVDPAMIWRIEGCDHKKLRPSTMRRIAEALGVHPGEIAEFVRGDQVADK